MGLSHRGKKHRKSAIFQKRKLEANEYTPSVLLTQCPRCHRGCGDHCTSVNKNGQVLAGPHPERVALARGPEGL